MRVWLVLAWGVWMVSLTATRVPVFHSNLTLWEAAVVGSVKPRPWVNLGTARLEQGDLDGAEAAYQQARDFAVPAWRTERDQINALTSLGQVEILIGRGQVEAARVRAWGTVTQWPQWAAAVHACQALHCQP